MFTRTASEAIRRRSGPCKVLVVVGAHGCGKSSAARAALPEFRRLDAEDAAFRNEFAADNLGALLRLDSPTIIDNAESLAQLFAVLPAYAARHPAVKPLVVLSSVNPSEHVGSAMDETRGLSVLEIGGLTTGEVFPTKPTEGWRKLWLRGGTPRAFLGNFREWHDANTRRLADEICCGAGRQCTTDEFLLLLRVLSEQHAQPVVLKKLTDASGVSRPTLAHVLSALVDRFVIRLVNGVSAIPEERSARTPRLYFRDTGLLHTLWGIRSEADLDEHPMRHDSWEAFVLEEAVRGQESASRNDETFFVFRNKDRKVVPIAMATGGAYRALFPHAGIADSQAFRSYEKRAREFGCEAFQIVDFTVATWGVPRLSASSLMKMPAGGRM